MALEHLKRCTPEEMAEMRAKGVAAKAEKAAYNLANEHKYKLNYLDQNYWQELASKHKVRMPTYNIPADVKGIRKMLKKCGVSNDVWKEHYTSSEYFLENNPKWTLLAVTGLISEIKEGL